MADLVKLSSVNMQPNEDNKYMFDVFLTKNIKISFEQSSSPFDSYTCEGKDEQLKQNVEDLQRIDEIKDEPCKSSEDIRDDNDRKVKEDAPLINEAYIKREHDQQQNDAVKSSEKMEIIKTIAVLPVVLTPGGSERVVDPHAEVLCQATVSGLKYRQPPITPVGASPMPTPSESRSSTTRRPASGAAPDGKAKKFRRSLDVNTTHDESFNALCADSGSEDEAGGSEDDEVPPGEQEAHVDMRQMARQLRNFHIFRTEAEPSEARKMVDDSIEREVHQNEVLDIESALYEVAQEVTSSAAVVDSRSAGAAEDGATGVAADGADDDNDEWKDVVADIGDVFDWTEDFSSFSGQEETYLRTPGPQVCFEEPVDLFLHVWDRSIMDNIVEQTNLYAQQFIDATVERGHPISAHLSTWKTTTVEELYRFFAILNFMSIGYFTRMDEYWLTGGVMDMPNFRKIMSRNRFFMILRFLHFVDNSDSYLCLRSYEKKVAKILPVYQHCMAKFREMYIPKRHLSLDESLLLWKGRLSWAQCIRSKAARFGIKSFELCEAETGYLLNSVLYAGKGSSVVEGITHGFSNIAAKVVIELMQDYLDQGHCLVMDNWYNQLVLTRFLKRRKTDVLGTLNRIRQNVPPAIKNINDREMHRGDMVACHCGDITLIAWKDVKLFVSLSTYHNNGTVPAQRAGEAIIKPKLVADYNRYMGGVDLKDQKLSMYLFERKRGRKWYMKVFKRLLNTTLMNNFILYHKYNMNTNTISLTHRQFRCRVFERLLARFPKPAVEAPLPVHTHCRLDFKHDHFMYPTETVPRGDRMMSKRRRCQRCSARGVRRTTHFFCKKCDVGLCPGQCNEEYHTVEDLSK